MTHHYNTRCFQWIANYAINFVLLSVNLKHKLTRTTFIGAFFEGLSLKTAKFLLKTGLKRLSIIMTNHITFCA